MESEHQFILSSGVWIGQGKITFSMSPDHLQFYTKWTIEKLKDGVIRCKQQVEMEGREETLTNTFTVSGLTAEGFAIEMSNELLGSIQGKGVLDKKTVAWEFRNQPEIEGFEVYELQDNGDYMLHAEFLSADHFRTIIDGRIWKKS